MKNKKLLSIIFFSTIFVTSSANAKISISSKDMKEGKMLNIEQVYNGFGCQGKNISPQISIKNIPAKAKSLAITLYDADAPTGSGWWHWVVYNIPVTKTEIAAGDKKIADGVMFGKNDFGTKEFGGVCPPVGHGKHKYNLTVYALSTEKLDLPKDASAALIGFNINANVVEKASVISVYERK
jgi:hypothetical protein